MRPQTANRNVLAALGMSQPRIVQILGRPSSVSNSTRPLWAVSSELTDMATFKARLIEAVQHFGIEPSPTPIAEWLGIERRQVVHNWFGVGKPSAKYLPLFQLKGVNVDWLLTGRGEMLTTPSEKQNDSAGGHDKALQEIIAMWNTLDARGRSFLRGSAQIAFENFDGRDHTRRGPAAKGVQAARSGGSRQRAKDAVPARRYRKRGS